MKLHTHSSLHLLRTSSNSQHLISHISVTPLGHLDLLKFKTGVTKREEPDLPDLTSSAEFVSKCCFVGTMTNTWKLLATFTGQGCITDLVVDVEVSSCPMAAIALSH